MVEVLLFVTLGAAALAGALAVVLAKNPIYSAIGLMGTLFVLAVFYVVHLAHFVAMVQVIVYAGAVMTLFLFVIMLIGVDRSEDTSETLPLQRWMVLAITGAVVVVGGVLAVTGVLTWVIPAGSSLEPNGTIEAISDILFRDWVLPVIGTGVLLTIAAVGAIALAYFRPRPRGEPQ